MLALDTQNAVRGYKVVATGGQAASLVDPKTLFRYPSGDPTPSGDDLRLTRRLSDAGKVLDLRVHDHLILGHGARYVSLADRGQMEMGP